MRSYVLGAALLLCAAAVASGIELPLYKGSWAGNAAQAGAAASAAGGNTEVIPGKYIVFFDSATKAGQAKAQLARGSAQVGAATIEREYAFTATGPSPGFFGFALSCPEAALDVLAAMDGLLAIEPDLVLSLNYTLAAGAPEMPRAAFGESEGGSVRRRLPVQSTNVPWGLDRIDQPGANNGAYKYVTTGAGVRVYVIDTGILLTHSEFGGRAVRGRDFVTVNGNANDCNGHGTHVAGTIGGATYGVAKGATLVAVRVLGCSGSGTLQGLLDSFNWVLNDDAPANVRKQVATSLGFGGVVASVNTAVQTLTNANIIFVAAAGNSNLAACGDSPASAPSALTVAASDSSNLRASFSNHGSCVDLFAPGVSILSAWHTSNTATNTISGTSMASPHVSGAVALLLQANPYLSATLLHNIIKTSAVSGAIGGTLPAGTPNLLLQTTGAGLCSTNADCNDGAACSTDTCNVATGLCSRTWSYAGASCCKKTASVCTAASQCCSSVCSGGFCT